MVQSYPRSRTAVSCWLKVFSRFCQLVWGLESNHGQGFEGSLGWLFLEWSLGSQWTRRDDYHKYSHLLLNLTAVVAPPCSFKIPFNLKNRSPLSGLILGCQTKVFCFFVSAKMSERDPEVCSFGRNPKFVGLY